MQEVRDDTENNNDNDGNFSLFVYIYIYNSYGLIIIKNWRTTQLK